MNGKRWAGWELEYLRKHWLEIGDYGLAKRLGRSLDSVRTKRYSLGIRINPADWSADEDVYILEHWSDQTEAQIAAELNRTPHAVHARGLSLGLFRKKPSVNKWRRWTQEEVSYLRDNWGIVIAG